MLWSDRYDRELADVFALQDEIATSVAAALKTAFAKPPPPSPIDPVAYDLFLQANAIVALDLEMDRRRMEVLEEVVDRAPTFARGWATLAYWSAFAFRRLGSQGAMAGLAPERAAEAAKTALRLDPQMGLAYQALGFLEPFAAHRKREELTDKALAAAPNDAAVVMGAGLFYAIVGRVQQGLSTARRAHELDPLGPVTTQQLGLQLFVAGLTEESGRLYDEAHARWPENATFAVQAILAAARLGDRHKVERLMRTWSGEPLAIWYARNLVDPDARSIRGRLDEQRAELARTGTVELIEPWRLHSLGLTEEAYGLLEEASFAHVFERAGPAGTSYPGLIFSRANPAFYKDVRFPRLCAKLGLADYWVETGKWPDCADEVPYDFRTEVRRLAG
jgi:tetratricopeptide (TPR) repeat protein